MEFKFVTLRSCAWRRYLPTTTPIRLAPGRFNSGGKKTCTARSPNASLRDALGRLSTSAVASGASARHSTSASAGSAWTTHPSNFATALRRPIVQADATALPLREGSVDAVVLLWMLYHLDDPPAALTEAKRVLSPGGVLAACAASRWNDPELVPAGLSANELRRRGCSRTRGGRLRRRERRGRAMGRADGRAPRP